jgi:DNA-binding transcriptional ArsR family regulator
VLRAGVAELRALAHPLRLRMMELFAEAPRTTLQVAELLGQPPTRLYHHVKALERAGLVRVRETRRVRGTVERWYEAPARLVSASLEPGSGAPPAGLAAAMVDQARREAVSALAVPGGEPPLVARMMTVGSPRFIAAVRRRIAALLEELRTAGDEGSDDADEATSDPAHWALTIAFAPAARGLGGAE